MIAGTIPIRTAQGQAELGTRQRKLSQRHRTVLFLTDGKRSAAEVCSMALQAGVPESCFDELLALGLLMLAEPAVTLPPGGPASVENDDVLHVDLPLRGPDSLAAPQDSLLPPSRTLHPESVSADSALGTPVALGGSSVLEAWLPSEPGGAVALDPGFVEARRILLRAVRAEAPIAGSLTLLRLRRAQTRADLVQLLDEVEARISKPPRSLAAAQTMRRVRLLLDGRLQPSLTPA